MNRRVIHSPDAPAAVGHYSQAIVSNGFVFTAGQIPLDPATGVLIEGDFKQHVNQVLDNLEAILKSAGTTLSKSVKLTVFVTDLSNFSKVNEVFTKRFSGMEPPARSAMEVSALPLGAQVEIECIAII